MAYCFGDGFDCYTATADAVAGYWDSGSTGALSLIAGRFAGGQAISFLNNTGFLIKSSAVNDAVHHIVLAFRQTAALSGASLGLYFQLTDNVTNQCCIVFRSDGVILLTSATPGGTVLATYAGAVTAQNTWFAFEFEVVINNTTGRFRARKNGNTVDDFDSGATLNTRPGANAYANKMTTGMSATVASQQIDDLLWRSDAAAVPFVGDIRCYTRMPASDASAQFARAPNPAVVTLPAGSTMNMTASQGRYTLCSPLIYTGTIGSAVCNLPAAFTGNMKCAIFANNAGSVSTVLATATAPIVNPVAGANAFTFSPALAVTKGTQYWLGFCTDATVTNGWNIGNGGNAAIVATGPVYASWPSSSLTGITTGQNAIASSLVITPTVNSELVNETLQDGTTSYVYDATVGHADFYNIAALSPSPASVVAVTTRGFIEKSDAGTRSGAVQIKSGATTVAAPTLALSTSFGWSWRTDTTNPATGTAWTAGAVDAVTIGPVVIS